MCLSCLSCLDPDPMPPLCSPLIFISRLVATCLIPINLSASGSPFRFHQLSLPPLDSIVIWTRKECMSMTQKSLLLTLSKQTDWSLSPILAYSNVVQFPASCRTCAKKPIQMLCEAFFASYLCESPVIAIRQAWYYSFASEGLPSTANERREIEREAT